MTCSVHHRALAALVCLTVAVGTVAVEPRSAVAQTALAYMVVPKLPSGNVTMRPGERLTLGELVNLVPLLPSPIVSVAVASAEGGVRLNDTAGVTRSTLAELLSTVVTANSDGMVKIAIDSRSKLGNFTVDSRSIGYLSVKFIASPTRYRVTPRESPLRVNAGSVFRLRDLVTFEKLDPNTLIQNFGFEVTGGVVCLTFYEPTTPVACHRVTTDVYPVYTDGILASRFTATASGRITLGLYVSSPVGGEPIETFVIDVEVNAPVTPRGLVASTDAPGPASTTVGATDSAPAAAASVGAASPSAPQNSQNNVTTTGPVPSSSGRPTVTTRAKPKSKPKSKVTSTR